MSQSISCNKCGHQSYDVLEIRFGTLVVRVCNDCRPGLIKELEVKQLNNPKPDVNSKEWRRRATRVAISFAPPIKPCEKCGWPVAEGFRCGCGGSADRSVEVAL
jgi:ribosomal protein L37E